MESVSTASDNHRRDYPQRRFSLCANQLAKPEDQEYSFGEDGIIDPNAGPGGSYRGPAKPAKPKPVLTDPDQG